MSQDQTIAAALRTARKRGGKVHKGAIHSSVAGRTDHLPMHVASGSYVIPADIISAMGEGNSMAGFKVAKDIFSAPNRTSGTPYGESGLPYGASTPHKATGGATAAPAAAKPTSGGFTGLKDMFDGGGAGKSGPTFSGGPLSGALNSLGVKPVGSGGGGGGSDFMNRARPVIGGLIGGPIGMLAGAAFNRNSSGQGYSGMNDMFNGGGPGASGADFEGGPYSKTINAAGINPLKGQASGPEFADGGATGGVPIVAAGGEYVIPPEDVVHIGGGDLDHGHKVLDSFVKKMRQKTIKTLQSLPGPKRD